MPGLLAFVPSCPSEPDQISAYTRIKLVESLDHQDAKGVSQWQKVAVGLLGLLQGTDYEDDYEEYLSTLYDIPRLRKIIRQKFRTNEGKSDLRAFDQLISKLSGIICQLAVQSGCPIDRYFVKAVLCFLNKNADITSNSLAWLSGQQVPTWLQYDDPSLRNMLQSVPFEQQPMMSLWIIQETCKAAKLTKMPLVLCIDQPEAGTRSPKTGDLPIVTISRFLDSLHQSCTSLITLLCVTAQDARDLLTHETPGTRDRVMTMTHQTLPPSLDQMKQIVRSRLHWFCKIRDLNPDDYPDLYPIPLDLLENLKKESAGIRTLLKECRKAFDTPVGPPPPPPPLEQVFCTKYQNLKSKLQIPKDDQEIADLLLWTFEMVEGKTIAKIKVKVVLKIADAKAPDLHFIVKGTDTVNKEVVIGVRVCHPTHPNSFIAAMKRLLDYETFGLTRGCLVTSRPIPRNYKAGRKKIDELTMEKGGEVIITNADQVAWFKEAYQSLAAIKRIYDNPSDYEFSPAQTIKLAHQLNLLAGNPLIDEIMSAP